MKEDTSTGFSTNFPVTFRVFGTSKYQAVGAILDSLFKKSPISLNFSDIYHSLHNSDFFKVYEAFG